MSLRQAKTSSHPSATALPTRPVRQSDLQVLEGQPALEEPCGGAGTHAADSEMLSAGSPASDLKRLGAGSEPEALDEHIACAPSACFAPIATWAWVAGM